MATSVKSTSTKKKTVKSSYIDYTFEDGTKFSGTVENLNKVASSLGMKVTAIGTIPKGYYISESKGLVKISTMNNHHLRRALISHTRNYYANVYNSTDSIKEFLLKYEALDSNSVIMDLYNELRKR